MNEKIYPNLKALFINCSLKPSADKSHTQNLLSKVAKVMNEAEVTVEQIHLRDHEIAFGMTKGAVKDGDSKVDDWPKVQEKIMAADILIIGTPIWLGMKSSLAALAIERMYAYSSDTNDKGQYLYYGQVGGCVVTGNEDGVKAVSKEVLYALQHIGFTIPPQADCGWIGAIGPGKSYGDDPETGDVPVGYDNEFTNKNATTMAWNLMHTAAMLKENRGIPAYGNTKEGWNQVPHVDYKKD